jgi:cardiolipin synthase
MEFSDWLLALLLLTNVLLGLVVWSVKRRGRPSLHLENEKTLDDLLPSIAGLTQGTIVGGNAVVLLENGAFFDSLFRDLESATSSIHFETYLAKPGEVTRTFAAILSARAQAGVHVRVMLDASGSRWLEREQVENMRRAGCRVCFYHGLRPRDIGRINNRTHRKIVVVDGRIGYVGGHCLVDSWLGKAENGQRFRDVSARVQGPVVGQLQSAFTDNWIEELSEVAAGPQFFPRLEPAGDSPCHAVYVSPTGSPSTVKLLHYLAIRAAKESIMIQNPYFLPDSDARAALVDAVRRGVSVRVMIPDEHVSDFPIVQHASHHLYGSLLEGGVRLFDYQRTLLHQKMFTVDHIWSAIGSTNFDVRSFDINDEISLVAFDRGLARRFEEIFERDLESCVERRAEDWSRRPLLHKLKDFSAFLFKDQL